MSHDPTLTASSLAPHLIWSSDQLHPFIVHQWQFEDHPTTCRWIPDEQAFLVGLANTGAIYRVGLEGNAPKPWKGPTEGYQQFTLSETRSSWQVVTSLADGRLQLWDSQARLVTEWQGHLPNKTRLERISCSLSQYGDWLATASSADGLLNLWRLPSADLHLTLPLPSISHGVLSQNGQLILTSYLDGRLELRSTHDGRLLQTFRGHSAASIAYDLQGELILSAQTKPSEVRVWDILQQDDPLTLKGQTAPLTDGHIEMLGEVVGAITAATDGTVRLWDIRRGVELAQYRFEGTPKPITSCDLREHFILCADGIGGNVYLLDYQTQPQPARHQGAVVGLACDAEHAYSIGLDQRLTLTHLADGQHESSLGLGQTPSTITLDDTYLFIGFENGTLHCYDRHSQRLRWEASAHTGTIRFLLRWSDGRIVSGGDDGLLAAWSAVSGARLSAVAIGDALMTGVIYEDWAIISTPHQRLEAWNILSGHQECTYDALSATALACHGDDLLAGTATGDLYHWKARSGHCIRQWSTSHTAITSLGIGANQFYGSDESGQLTAWGWDQPHPVGLWQAPHPLQTLLPIGADGDLLVGDGKGGLHRVRMA